jgi:rhodanese-related sulfurtransferase
MPSPNTITVEKLARLIGVPQCPVLIDVRIDDDFAADPRLIPGSTRKSHNAIPQWQQGMAGKPAIVICQRGAKLSHGTAAWLRHLGSEAGTLEGGYEAWQAAGLPLVPDQAIPPRDGQGRTVWVTRHRPKIDRIACPWLIRRFVDPEAVFLFVAPSEVKLVADRFNAAPFDIEDTFWSHRGERCTFDTMIEEFKLTTEPLERLADIVRAADTAALDQSEQAAGLLAISLGLSRLYSDDLEQLAAGMTLYDALYRWCRDATDETHNWPAARP